MAWQKCLCRLQRGHRNQPGRLCEGACSFNGLHVLLYLMRVCEGLAGETFLIQYAGLIPVSLTGHFRISEHVSDFHQGKAKNIGAGPAGSV